MKKYCHQCRNYLPVEQFYKSKDSNDGLQSKCKTCCKLNNKKFREKNPKYYWGSPDSYFVKHYDEELDYLKRWGKADKLCLIYQLEIDGRVYIGSTKRSKIQISNSLKQDYNHMKRQKEPRMTPILIAFKKYTRQEVYKLVDGMTILKQFDGTRQQMRQEMVKIITELRLSGKDVINKRVN